MQPLSHFEHSASVCRTARGQPVTIKKIKISHMRPLPPRRCAPRGAATACQANRQHQDVLVDNPLGPPSTSRADAAEAVRRRVRWLGTLAIRLLLGGIQAGRAEKNPPGACPPECPPLQAQHSAARETNMPRPRPLPPRTEGRARTLVNHDRRRTRVPPQAAAPCRGHSWHQGAGR